MRCSQSLKLLAMSALGLAAGVARAQFAVSTETTGNGRTHLTPNFSVSTVQYDPKHGDNFDVDRKMLGVQADVGLNATVDAIIGGGLILKTEMENVDQSGRGYVVVAGAKGRVHKAGNVGVYGHGYLSWQSETIKRDFANIDLDSYDIHLGSTVTFALAPKVTPYAGLDLTVLSDGTAKIGSGKGDYERADIIDLKLGVDLAAGNVVVRPEVTLVGEKTFALSASLPL